MAVRGAQSSYCGTFFAVDEWAGLGMHIPTATTRFFTVLCLFVLTQISSSASAGDLGQVEAPLALAQELFPDADRCEPQVRLINSPRVEAIVQRLPRTVGYHELGSRVVYSVFRGSEPLGLVHVRQESGEWGLIKIAWAFNTDLTIQNFALLRCREPDQAQVTSTAFRTSLVGQNSESLTAQLSSYEYDSNPLPRIVIGSALKSLAVTKVAWPLTTLRLRIRQAGHSHFPEAAAIRFTPGVRSSRALDAFEKDGLGTIDRALLNSLILAQVFDQDGTSLGSIVHVRALIDPSSIPLLFTIINGRLVTTDLLLSESSASLRTELGELRGRNLHGLSELGTPLARSAAVAVSISTHKEESHDNL